MEIQNKTSMKVGIINFNLTFDQLIHKIKFHDIIYCLSFFE